MKTIVGLGLFAIVGLASADDVRTQPIHNLNHTAFCFNKPVKLDQSDMTAAPLIVPARGGTSKNVKCSLQVDSAMFPSVGTCIDPNDPDIKYRNTIENYRDIVNQRIPEDPSPELYRKLNAETNEKKKKSIQSEIDRIIAKKRLVTDQIQTVTGQREAYEREKAVWDKKTRDLPPYHDHMKFEGIGINSAEKTTMVQVKRYLSDQQVQAYLADMRTGAHSGKWKGIFVQELTPKNTAYAPDQTTPDGKLIPPPHPAPPQVRYYRNVPTPMVSLAIQDPNNNGFVTHILCSSKRKAFSLSGMTIGDLEDAFGGNLRLDADPSTTPKPEAAPAIPRGVAGGKKANPQPAKNSKSITH